MPSTTAAGTAIAISSTTPTTQDAAGYGALTYTEIGQVEKLGTLGATFAKVEFQPLKGPKQKHKGSADYGSLQPSMAFDDADAGQTLLRTAAADETSKLYAFRVTYPTGALRYFLGRVFGAPENVDGADSIVMSMPTVEINTRVVRAGSGAPVLTPLSSNVFLMGDSRIASVYNDVSTRNNKNAGNHLVVANTQMGQRMTFVGTTAVAGQRSDQYNSGTSTMTASSAPTVIVFGVVNDIAQGRTGAECWSTVKGIIDAAIAAGKSVIAHTEPGSNAFTSAMIAHRDTFNASLRAYAAANPQTLRVFDFAASVLVDPTRTDAIVFKTNYMYVETDGTTQVHLSKIGARAVGNDFAAWSATQMSGAGLDLVALHASNLATNARFTTTTGGNTVTGISGPVPASWNANKGGTPTATVSTGAAPDSNGNEFIAAITFTAASDRLLFSQQITTGLAMGDKVRFAAEIAVDAGSVNLRSVRAYATAWFDGVAVNVVKFDMQPLAVDGNGPSTAFVDLVSPDILTLTRSGSTTFDRLDVAFAAEGSGSGSATIRIRKVVVVKV